MASLTSIRTSPVRFEYDRLTPTQFREELNCLGMSIQAFARIFGLNVRKAERIYSGQEADVPIWIGPVMELLRLPNALSTVRDAAAHMIRLDNDHPERGAYPYRDGRAPED